MGAKTVGSVSVISEDIESDEVADDPTKGIRFATGAFREARDGRYPGEDVISKTQRGRHPYCHGRDQISQGEQVTPQGVIGHRSVPPMFGGQTPP
jgi:hypothetical protein